MELAAYLDHWRERVDGALDEILAPQEGPAARVHEGLRYAVLGPGKRLRPILAVAACEACGGAPDTVLHAAGALELVHCYSLVHDDLPAMDDDDLRRGLPTCHRAFDEATALLAGDALQTLAFHVLAHDPRMHAGPAERVAMIEALAIASGSRGMAGGQAIDLAAVGQTLDLAQLENMHIHKTGALIRASVKLGALSAPDLAPDDLARLDHYAKCIGLAFQIQDDILDVEGDTATLGKKQGADQALNKPTYPALMGLSESKRRAADLHEQAVESVARFGESASTLRWLSEYIVSRAH